MPIDIFLYDDYRAYLAAWLEHRRPAVSLRTLARRVGCSAALTSQIVNGRSDLEPSRVSAFNRALEHDDDEAAYFHDLVVAEHGSSLRERRAAASRAVAARRFMLGKRGGTQPMLLLLSRWYMPAILQIAQCEDFVADPGWIAERLFPPITPDEAAEALDQLVAAGLLVRRDDGAVAPATATVATDREIAGQIAAAARQQYRWVLARAAAVMGEVPHQERHFGMFTTTIHRDDLPKVKEAIERFQVELMHLCEQRPGTGVYQIALQLFPLTRPPLTGR